LAFSAGEYEEFAIFNQYLALSQMQYKIRSVNTVRNKLWSMELCQTGNFGGCFSFLNAIFCAAVQMLAMTQSATNRKSW